MELYYLYINVKVCMCQLEAHVHARAGKGEQLWSGGEAVMAEQRGLPVVRRTCSYSREGVTCPVVRYEPFRMKLTCLGSLEERSPRLMGTSRDLQYI